MSVATKTLVDVYFDRRPLTRIEQTSPFGVARLRFFGTSSVVPGHPLLPLCQATSWALWSSLAPKHHITVSIAKTAH